MKIALVEDDKLTRQRLQALLAASLPQAQVLTFERLAAALAHANAAKADYWLIDLGLPDGSGIDLIRQVRSQDASAHILVISVFGDVVFGVNALGAKIVAAVELISLVICALAFIIPKENIETIKSEILVLRIANREVIFLCLF